ncbi:MAG: hypothetical protein AB2800_09695 [Candidatus Thiodiazotropha endolucinida]
MGSYEKTISERIEKKVILIFSFIIIFILTLIIIFTIKDHKYANKIINSIGLLYDIFGAILIAYTIVFPLKKPAKKGSMFLSNIPRVRAMVVNEYIESKAIYMFIGVEVILFGFLQQLISNWI